MPYLVADDYLPQIRETIRTRVTEDDAAVLAGAEAQVQAFVQGYLISRYDMPTEWARTGTARCADLVRCMVDIIIYDIMSRVAPNQMPAGRQTRYDNAIEWLKMVNKGQISPALPLPAAPEDGSPSAGGMMLGSAPRFNL